jgi:hypothetical protein
MSKGGDAVVQVGVSQGKRRMSEAPEAHIWVSVLGWARDWGLSGSFVDGQYVVGTS